MKLYLGCSLTHSKKEYHKKISELRDKLRKDYIVFDFIGLIKWTNETVYNNDRNCVKTSDIIIVDCSYPSTWLGYEIWMAVELWKPVLAFAKNKALVSRLILWITKPNFSFERFSDFDDLYNKIIKRLKKINI